ncbi:hypothetical protein BITS_1833 [Bifidobacterium tsurumiense]|uniref:Uncharacterized protein n=1 Tax=Bifidobacterium tsurumiense TaxID=356829 RepID=A0A087EE17_9BIFI|nr:hypothetical protein BITS_1833 [Bifidobacterium tsurumiense]
MKALQRLHRSVNWRIDLAASLQTCRLIPADHNSGLHWVLYQDSTDSDRSAVCRIPMLSSVHKDLVKRTTCNGYR